MLWVVQKDLFLTNKKEDLPYALERLGIAFIMVDVKNNTIYPDVAQSNNLPIITNGSIMLSNIARSRGWSPGSFFNENFSYDVWANHYKDLLLNKNAQICTLAQATITQESIFARPILDNKTFNGRVFTRDEFLQFQSKSIALVPGVAKPETKILISKTKRIGQEHRHYIVDGKVVTSSRYKLAGLPNFSEGCDDVVLEVVYKALKRWQPSRAFVMDTYISGDEIGIVEIGCICHAGGYKANVMALVDALDNMPLKDSELVKTSHSKNIGFIK